MTPEEAITYLEDLRQLAERYLIEAQIPTVKALNIAIEAVNKRTPRKPKMIKGVSGMEYGVCPACDSVTIFKFCVNCGQAIDRSWRSEK